MNTPCILLVEDDKNDVFFMRRAFAIVAMDQMLRVVADGQEAIDYLAGHEEFGDRGRFPFPSLLLLDLKLPRLDGFEVLTWIRETARDYLHLLGAGG